jgi:tetratricopeptide (TPR) repeat protein
MKLRRLLIFFPVLITASLFAQDKDSLALQRRMATMTPAEKLEIYDSVVGALTMQNPSLALAYCDQAMQVAEDADLPALKGKAKTNFSWVLRKTGNPSKAKAEAAEAVKYCIEAGDSTCMYQAYIESGNVAFVLADYTNAILFFTNAQNIAHRLKNKRGEGTCSNNIANVYVTQGYWDKALVRYIETRDIFVNSGDTLFAALALDNMANCYQNLGQDDKAIESHMKALAELEKHGDKMQVAETAINLSAFFIDRKKPEQGLFYAQRAVQLSIESNYAYGQCLGLLNSSEAYYYMERYAEADSTARAALQIGIDNQIMEVQMYSLEQLAKVAEKSGRPADALKYLREFLALKDTIFDSEKEGLIAEMSAKYEAGKKDDEISSLTKEREQQRMQMLYLGGGLIVVLVFSVMLVRVNAARKKANQLLASQNFLIAEKNKDITDSITYARRIQQSVMPDERLLKEIAS